MRYAPGMIRRPDDGGPKEALQVTTAGKLETWNDFFCDGSTADDVAPLEDGDGKSSTGEICCGREAIVAAADDQCVPFLILQSTRSSAGATT